MFTEGGESPFAVCGEAVCVATVKTSVSAYPTYLTRWKGMTWMSSKPRPNQSLL